MSTSYKAMLSSKSFLIHQCPRAHVCTTQAWPAYDSKRVFQRTATSKSTRIRAENGPGENKGSGESPEKLFQQELQRRGISGTEQEDRTSGRTSTSQTDPPPPFRQDLRSQLEESRKLNSEGLEGLIPRAKQLLTLGLTFFLAFLPAILIISVLFSLIYWLFGSNFVHGGRPSFTPYIDPAELLNEPTVDERIPYY